MKLELRISKIVILLLIRIAEDVKWIRIRSGVGGLRHSSEDTSLLLNEAEEIIKELK